MTAPDHESVTDTSPADGAISPTIKVTGVLLAAWCLGFAAVNGWQLATGRLTDAEFRGYTTALVVASIRAVAYVLFFLAGAAMSAALTVSYHRRHRLHWTTVAAGIIAPPSVTGRTARHRSCTT